MMTSSEQIEGHLASMEASDTSTDDGAHEALAHAMSAVTRINLHVGGEGKGLNLVRDISDDVIERFDDWMRRLLAGVTKIAVQLRASFSVTVGTAISLTMNFGPFSDSNA
jgi:hypothetical protein